MRHLFFAILLLFPIVVFGQHGSHAPAKPAAPVTLEAGLGDINHPVTTNNQEAQKFFNQGLAYVYAFNHAEAQRAFREALLSAQGIFKHRFDELNFFGCMPLEELARRLGVVAQDRARRAIDPAVVPAHQRLQRLRIALAGARHELQIAGRCAACWRDCGCRDCGHEHWMHEWRFAFHPNFPRIFPSGRNGRGHALIG